MLRAKAHRREGYCLVAFGMGQALGFYGSWTFFTLAHHNTVWLSTELVDLGLLPMLSWVTILLSEMRRYELEAYNCREMRDADTNQPLDLPIVIILSSLVLDDLETTEQGTLSLAPPPEAHQRWLLT